LPRVVRTPVKIETHPIIIDPYVCAPAVFVVADKIKFAEPDKVDKTMAGTVIIRFLFADNFSALTCIQL
jgi:hypothetical protein